jgi:hypothetical protein
VFEIITISAVPPSPEYTLRDRGKTVSNDNLCKAKDVRAVEFLKMEVIVSILEEGTVFCA